ncbi:DUF6660 family protein [Pedobacter antarcticus]|uniref:DUF6660 family protein n=1 Tax=Pedobacter antarcticus TaxID=34086 RepID=UPI00374245F2
MKFWSRFICIVIIALSCAPCADAAAYNQSSLKTSFTKPVTSQTHNQHRTDACSPFCVCACCNTPTFVRQIIVSIEIPIQIIREYSNGISGKATSTSLSVWQPPQLG